MSSDPEARSRIDARKLERSRAILYGSARARILINHHRHYLIVPDDFSRRCALNDRRLGRLIIGQRDDVMENKSQIDLIGLPAETAGAAAAHLERLNEQDEVFD